jgi:hypothetical protein
MTVRCSSGPTRTIAARRAFTAVFAAMCACLLVATTASAAPKTHSPTTSSALSSLLTIKSGPAGPLELGDTIVLTAGSLYTGTFTLPLVNTGTGYITVTSSALSSLPAEGVRINPSNASLMPKVQTDAINVPAISFAPSAHHYKLIGLELIAPANNLGFFNGILHIGEGDSSQNSLTLVPHDIVVDRCIIRPNIPKQNLARGIMLHGATVDIKNCHISNIHTDGIESQAILGYNGPGPYNIDNNYLSAAGENIMFGGAANFITDMNPSNIAITRNHFHLPLSWRVTSDTPEANEAWAVKNLLELKHGTNVTIEGNIFENSFHDAGNQFGAAMVFKTERIFVTNNGQGRPWYVTENITVRKNIIRNVGLGVSIAGGTESDGGPMLGYPRNVTIENNIFQNINHTDWPGNRGIWFFMGQASPNIKFDHNTAFHTDSTALIWGGTFTNFIFTNNVFNHAGFGFHGDGQGDGKRTFDFYCPGNTWLKNVNQGGIASLWLPEYHAGWSPTSLQFPSTWAGVLVNQSNPGSDYAGWKVVPGSAYDNAGTDGKDVGADIDAVNAATAGCVSGVWGPPTGGGQPVTVALKNGLNGYNGNTSFYVDGQSPTTHFGPDNYRLLANTFGGTTGYVARPFYKFNVSQAATGIPANAVITSATLQLHSDFSGGSSDGTIKIHRVAPVNNTFAVNYLTATRNTYNGTNQWTGGANAGGDVSNLNNDFLDTPDSTSQLPPEGQAGTFNFDVTSSVQAWVNGQPNNGWIVLPAARTAYLGTSADLHGPSDFPVLTVIYQSSTTPLPTTKVLKNGTNGYAGNTSFEVSGQSPTSHFGSSAYTHHVNPFPGNNFWTLRSFYKFDLSPTASGIPANAVIDSAKLKMKIEYSGGSTDAGIKIHRVGPVNNAFTVNYATATRNSYNGTSSTWTGGQNGAGDVVDSNNDFLDTPDSTVTLPAEGATGFIEFDVRSSVQAWVNGTTNNGWLILPNARTVYIGTPADLHGSADFPELTITYH